MGNVITPDSRALWLMMARQRGWWTIAALYHFWKPTFPEWELQQLVDSLTPGGYLVAREVSPGQISYAVTSECKPLPGTDLADSQCREAA